MINYSLLRITLLINFHTRLINDNSNLKLISVIKTYSLLIFNYVQNKEQRNRCILL